MKKLITLLLVLPSMVMASDLYVDAYRFGNQSHTGKIGITYNNYNAEYSFSNGSVAIGGRKYISFANIEIGAQAMITNAVMEGADDHRVIDVEGGWHVTINPYFKAGSDLFLIAKLDESNKAVFQIGFNLY